MVATCWHFAYGIWLFAAKWGITPGDNARKYFGYVCAAGGTALCALGLVGMLAFLNPNYNHGYPDDVMPAQPPGLTQPASAP
jgi:succinate dehydrogenase / fumarate reductase cytochrome b subunit